MKNYKNIKYIIPNKRFILFLSIILTYNASFAQDYKYADLYTENIFLNPSYISADNYSTLKLNYQNQYIYNFYSTSIKYFSRKYNSAIALLGSNLVQGKQAFSDLNISAIYSYRINVDNNKILNTALQVSYLQQNINSANFIYPDMINIYTGTIEASTEISTFEPRKAVDFSFGISYISKKYRLGVSAFHLQDLYTENQTLTYSPKINFHFARLISQKSFDNNKKLSRFTPELIYVYQRNFEQIIIGFTFEKNVFLARFWLKNNLNFNQISPVFTLGLNLEKVRISYTYNISVSKHFSLPVNTNQISLAYILSCREKRNNKNTIYCTNF